MYDNTFVAHDFLYTALEHKVIVQETIPVTVYNSNACNNTTHTHKAMRDLLKGTSYVKYRSYIKDKTPV